MSENKDKQFPRSEAAKKELIRTEFPKEKPIFWGPKQETTFPDTYKEPEGWREKQLLKIPEVVRFYTGSFGPINKKRTIYLGSMDYAFTFVVQSDAVFNGGGSFGSASYMYQGDFSIGHEIKTKFGARRASLDQQPCTTLELLNAHHAISHRATFSCHPQSIATPENSHFNGPNFMTDPSVRVIWLAGKWRIFTPTGGGSLEGLDILPQSQLDPPTPGRVELFKPTMTRSLATWPSAADFESIHSGSYNYCDFIIADTDPAARLYNQSTLHLYMINIVAGGHQTNEFGAIQDTSGYGKSPPYTGSGQEYKDLKYTYYYGFPHSLDVFLEK